MITNLLTTAYCACTICCGPKADGITASGAKPVQGVTVAASRSIPFGTVIEIEGVGRRVVQDRMHKKFDGTRMDIYFSSHKAAKHFGIKRLKVTIPESKK